MATIETVLLPHVRKGDHILQIGAMDGQSFDPVFPILQIREDVWATLVEPMPESVESLRTLWAENNRVAILPFAIGDTDGQATMRFIPPGNHRSIEMQGMSSMIDGANMLAAYPQLVETCYVPCVTYATFRERCAAGSIDTESVVGDQMHPLPPDILVTDCEGADLSIIAQVIKFGDRPRVVLAETQCFTYDEDDLMELLEPLGYVVADRVGELDTLFVRAS